MVVLSTPPRRRRGNATNDDCALKVNMIAIFYILLISLSLDFMTKMSSLVLFYSYLCACVCVCLSAPRSPSLSLSLMRFFVPFYPSLFIRYKTRDIIMFATSSSTASSSLHSSPVLREKKQQQQQFVFFARNPGRNRVSSSSSQSASFGILTAAAAAAARGGRGGEQRKNGNEAEEAIIKRKSLVASSAAMMITTTTTTAFAAEEAVSSLAEGGTNGTLESVRLVVALSSIALILFQGPKGDGVVNTLSEKRVFSSAKNAKSAVDYVTYALIGGFIVLSAVLAVG